jgi:hypothetical protein
MSLPRRAVAVLLQLLLLQVSLLVAGTACARGAELAAVAAHASHAASHHAASHHAASHHAASHHDAPRPSAPAQHDHGATHCMMAAGCALVAEETPTFETASLVVVHAALADAPARLHPSARQAPEPPPPRG